jgi:hypothetical protein
MKDAWFHARHTEARHGYITRSILHCRVDITVPQSSLLTMNGAVAFICSPDDARKLLKARMKERNIRMPVIHPPP